MATVTVYGGVTGDAAAFVASDSKSVPRPRHADVHAHHGRSSCGRCRQAILQGVIADAPQTWVTAAEGDPWCQGGAHLPKAIHLGAW